MQTALHGSEGGMGLRLRRFWSWLQRRIPPDEALLRRLRKAGTIVVHHPSTVHERGGAAPSGRSTSRAVEVRHLLGLALNLAISPLTVLLVPLPGPNVVGFWFVYRIVCHALALLGIRRASGPRVTTDFRPSADLDVVPGETLRSRAARIAAGYGLAGLGAFLRRIAAREIGQGLRGSPMIRPSGSESGWG